jgi:predicted nucleic acid-binding protein
MNHYLDTSVVVALLLQDMHSSEADAWLIRTKPTFLISDFCAVEFAAVISRRVRMNGLTADNASLALRRFDDCFLAPFRSYGAHPSKWRLPDRSSVTSPQNSARQTPFTSR